jgi:hypothetical protein
VRVAATGEPSRDAAVATGPQQEEATAATATTLHVLVPYAPSQGCRQARPESRPAGEREAVVDAADDEAPPGWGQWGSQPASAPERDPEVLVMREDGCVMSQHLVPDAEASTLRAAPPAPDVVVVHPKQELCRAGALPTHFDEAQAEQALWQEFRDHCASINNADRGAAGPRGSLVADLPGKCFSSDSRLAPSSPLCSCVS